MIITLLKKEKQMFGNKLLNFLYAFLSVAVTAGLCGYLNDFGLSTFYQKIDLPLFTPPNNVFPIVWGILYTLLIISTTLVLNSEETPKVKSILQIFWLNMLFQIIWTYLFFYCGMFLAGFFAIILLDFITLWLIDAYHKIQKTASYLLIPYLLWLIFATYLNWGIIDLNGTAYVF